MITTTSPASASRRIRRKNSIDSCGVRAEFGSSNSITRASRVSARVISVRCCTASPSSPELLGEAQLLEQRIAGLAHLGPAPAALLVAGEDVLSHSQVREQLRFLVDDRDAIGAVVPGPRLAVNQDFALIAVYLPGEDL